MRRRIFPMVLVMLVILEHLLHPATSSANGGDTITYISSLERLFGMVTLYEPTFGHGSFGGKYTKTDKPIEGLDFDRANALIMIIGDMLRKAKETNEHIGFCLPPGDYILLDGTTKGIAKRIEFTVPGPNNVCVEISGLYYDPRSDDFAVRTQSSHKGEGHHPRNGSKDFSDPIPGGAIYIELHWDQVRSMVAGAHFTVTSSILEGFSPNKDWNMRLAGERMEAYTAGGVTYFDAIQAMQIVDGQEHPDYRKWVARINHVPVPDVIASGVCAELSPVLGAAFRLFLATDDFPEELDGGGHTEKPYNPTTNDYHSWQQDALGRYFVDWTVLSPGTNVTFKTSRPFELTADVLPLKGDTRTFSIVGARHTDIAIDGFERFNREYR